MGMQAGSSASSVRNEQRCFSAHTQIHGYIKHFSATLKNFTATLKTLPCRTNSRADGLAAFRLASCCSMSARWHSGCSDPSLKQENRVRIRFRGIQMKTGRDAEQKMNKRKCRNLQKSDLCRGSSFSGCSTFPIFSMGLSVSGNKSQHHHSLQAQAQRYTQEAGASLCVCTFIKSREGFAVQAGLQAGGGDGEPGRDGQTGCWESQWNITRCEELI